ncbi:MAG TPA: TonB-dependent receptor, partial [Vicinamibacterales bacterium]|nr:TonB-dependent receptor [Vicinamibacterales bacterium]
LASDLDYVRSIHSVRAGIVLAGGSYHTDDTANYLGTYTFESLAAFEAGTPQTFTRRIGDPNIDYFNLQAAGYLQDDIRVRKGLTLTPGLRYEVQTHLRDFSALGPRLGVTWAPFKNGKTTLRASAGVFTDWLNSGTYEQTLRVDGIRQQELDIVNPSYPDPGNVGVVPPINKYLLADDLQMARNVRLSSGIDYALNPFSRLGVSYAHVSGSRLQRGLNLNAPVNGIRPTRRSAISSKWSATRPRVRTASTRSCRSASRRRRWRRRKSAGTGSGPTSVSTTRWPRSRTTPTARLRCRRPEASRMIGGRRRTTCATAPAYSSVPAGSGTSTPT